MQYYTLQSCDETKYPSITNLYWNGTHPYEGLFVTIDEIFKGELIDKSKKYQLVSTKINLIISNVPKLILADFQNCNVSNKYVYKNCKTGEYRIFVFSLHPPLRNSLKIDGDCEVWELQHKIEDRAIRIIRASDNAELDIGFVNNDLDEQAIKDFGGYNLLGYTEDLTHSSWLKENYNSSGQIPVITSNVIANPLTGEQNATRIDFNAVDVNGISAIRQLTPQLDGEQLVEVYLKTIEGSGIKNLRMRIDSDQGAISKNFNVTETWTKYFINVGSNRTNVTSWSLRLRPLTGTDTTASVYFYAPQWVQGVTSLPYQPRTAGGASDCFVTTLYNQNGDGNHATQTIASNQPKIYDIATGEVTKENGKPAMVFDGMGDSLDIPNVAGKSNIDAFFVNKHNEMSTTATNPQVYLYPTGNGATNFGFVGSVNSPTSSLKSISYGSPNLYKNNTLLSPATRGEIYNLLGETQNIINHQGATTLNWTEFGYGQYNSGGGVFHFEGSLQEIIIYDTNLTTSERVSFHNNLKAYYFYENASNDNIFSKNLLVAFSLRKLFNDSFKEYVLHDNYTECDNCEDLNFIPCRNGERTIGAAITVELPKPLPPDRGFDKCCYNNLVLADYNDHDPYKNDFNGFFFKRPSPNSTVEFVLIDLSDSSEYNLNDGTYGIFMPFNGNQIDLTYYIVEWRKVLSVLGTGNYQIKKELTIAGISFNILSNTFNLQEFSIENADKTVRFDSYMNGKLIHIDTDFLNSGYKSSLRVPGFFGRADYSFEEDRISQRDYKFKQNIVNRSTEYKYQADLLPECITSELWDFLLFGDEIQISDYNKNNHSYKYDRISVKLENNGGTEFSSLTRNANINLSFSNRIENNRKTNC